MTLSFVFEGGRFRSFDHAVKIMVLIFFDNYDDVDDFYGGYDGGFPLLVR